MADNAEKIERVDVEAIRRDYKITDIASRRWGVEFKKAGRLWRGKTPFRQENTPSFFVDLGKRRWNCYSTGASGDVIGLVMQVDGLNFLDAVAEITGGKRLSPEEEARRAERARRDQAEREARQATELARKLETIKGLWETAIPGDDTPVEAYFRWRGVDVDAITRLYGRAVPESIRYIARLPYFHEGVRHVGPAMVAKVENAAGEMIAIHRTWLAPGGRGKADLPDAKLALGPIWGGFTLLTSLCERALMGEGNETAYTAVGALASRGERCCGISALNLPNMAGGGLEDPRAPWRRAANGRLIRAPSAIPDPDNPGLVLPKIVKRNTIIADADGKSPQDTKRLLTRADAKFRAAGALNDIAWPPHGCDLNDLAMEDA